MGKRFKQKQYENKIVNNYDKDFKARILWTNSPIKFNVIRYMCDLDVNGNAINWRAVPANMKGSLCSSVVQILTGI